MKTMFIKMTEMVDPNGRWDYVINEIKKGYPIIIYTKNIVPSEVLSLKQKNFIISITITGWGGTWLEPMVPETSIMINLFKKYAKILGRRLILRVDPIVPTYEGMHRAMTTIDQIIEPTKIISSILQLYQGHEKLAKELGIDWSKYTVQSGRALFVNQSTANHIVNTILETSPSTWLKNNFQMCGMPYEIENVKHTGCVDEEMLNLMEITDFERISEGKQRPGCKCIIAKRQLLSGKCSHGCLYCYAHKENLHSLD